MNIARSGRALYQDTALQAAEKCFVRRASCSAVPYKSRMDEGFRVCVRTCRLQHESRGDG